MSLDDKALRDYCAKWLGDHGRFASVGAVELMVDFARDLAPDTVLVDEFACPSADTTDIEPLLARLDALHLKYVGQSGSVFGWAKSEILAWRNCAKYHIKKESALVEALLEIAAMRPDKPSMHECSDTIYGIRMGEWQAGNTARRAISTHQPEQAAERIHDVGKLIAALKQPSGIGEPHDHSLMAQAANALEALVNRPKAPAPKPDDPYLQTR